MSLSGTDLTSLCFLLHPPLSAPVSRPAPRAPEEEPAAWCHTPVWLEAVAWRRSKPWVSRWHPLHPPCHCLLRPVDVSKWQMMVGVCAAAWEEECQGRSFPAVSFNLLYPCLLKNPTPPNTLTQTHWSILLNLPHHALTRNKHTRCIQICHHPGGQKPK